MVLIFLISSELTEYFMRIKICIGCSKIFRRHSKGWRELCKCVARCQWEEGITVTVPLSPNLRQSKLSPTIFPLCNSVCFLRIFRREHPSRNQLLPIMARMSTDLRHNIIWTSNSLETISKGAVLSKCIIQHSRWHWASGSRRILCKERVAVCRTYVPWRLSQDCFQLLASKTPSAVQCFLEKQFLAYYSKEFQRVSSLLLFFKRDAGCSAL